LASSASMKSSRKRGFGMKIKRAFSDKRVKIAVIGIAGSVAAYGIFRAVQVSGTPVKVNRVLWNQSTTNPLAIDIHITVKNGTSQPQTVDVGFRDNTSNDWLGFQPAVTLSAGETRTIDLLAADFFQNMTLIAVAHDNATGLESTRTFVVDITKTAG
jgi:hypothetical protein